jgi:hypothetical protein
VLLLRGAGTNIRLRDSTEIIFISWLVNCLVPAKLGDVYRAYLLRLNATVSLSRTSGPSSSSASSTCSRSCCSAWRPASGASAPACRRAVQLLFVLGLVVLAGLAIGLYTVRNFGSRIIRRLPLPIAWSTSTTSSRRRLLDHPAQVPILAVITRLIWATEALRLYFVIQALGLSEYMGISGASSSR